MTKDLSWMAQPFAHRGLHDASKGIVENSRSAVQAAVDHRFGFEVDIRAASCGNVVVFHDDHLDRLTHETGLLRNQTMSKLQTISFRDTRDRMMSLQNLLELVGGRVPMLLEIKSDWLPDPRQVDKLMATIIDQMSAYKGDFALMSFDSRLIHACRKLAPAIPRGLISEQFPDNEHWRHLSRGERWRERFLMSFPYTRPDFIAYDIEALPALAPLIARRLFNKPLLTWTVRTQHQQRRAQKYCDAMIFEGFVPSNQQMIANS